MGVCVPMYRVINSSPHRKGRLYGIESVHPLGYTVTDEMLSLAMQDTPCVNVNIYQMISQVFHGHSFL